MLPLLRGHPDEIHSSMPHLRRLEEDGGGWGLSAEGFQILLMCIIVTFTIGCVAFVLPCVRMLNLQMPEGLCMLRKGGAWGLCKELCQRCTGGGAAVGPEEEDELSSVPPSLCTKLKWLLLGKPPETDKQKLVHKTLTPLEKLMLLSGGGKVSAGAVASGAVEPDTPASDRCALEDFFAQTQCDPPCWSRDGDIGSGRTNWLDDNVPIGRWQGVTVQSDPPQRLTKLILPSNHIQGPLAPLAPLSGIKALILPCNGLSGPVEALRGLVNLRDLDLSGNKLTGPVDALMSLGQLVELNLGDNSLSDTLDAFAGLRRLRRLVLRNNQFWGPLAMLDGLASGSLEVLDLSGDANCGLGGPRPPEISRKWSAGGLNLNTTGTQVGLRGPTEPTDGRPRTGDGRPRTGGARSRPSSPLMALMSLAQASQGKRNGGISLVGRISSTDARASALQRAKAHPKGPPAELLAAKAKPLTDDQANEVNELRGAALTKRQQRLAAQRKLERQLLAAHQAHLVSARNQMKLGLGSNKSPGSPMAPTQPAGPLAAGEGALGPSPQTKAALAPPVRELHAKRAWGGDED